MPQCLGPGLNGLVTLYVWSGLSLAGQFEGVAFKLFCTLQSLEYCNPSILLPRLQPRLTKPEALLFKAPQVIAVYGQVWATGLKNGVY